MMSKMEIAHRLRDLRHDAGLTITEVGQAIGKTPQAVYAWEVGRNAPDFEALQKICSVYGITVGELFDEGSGTVLSQSERWVLDMWRRASDDDRLLVRLALKKYDLTADADPGAAAV